MEAEKTLTNEEIIRELLDLLKKNAMKEPANDVFEICTYVDGLEKKIASMTEELTSMQDQIKKMQEERNEVYAINKVLLKGTVSSVQEDFFVCFYKVLYWMDSKKRQIGFISMTSVYY